MLTELRIHRYRGIFSGQISGLAPVNVLIGPNGSGKSTLLEAVFMATQLATGPNSPATRRRVNGSYQPLLAARHGTNTFPDRSAHFANLDQHPILVHYFFDPPLVQQREWQLTVETGKARLAPPGSSKLDHGIPPVFAGMRFLDLPALLDSETEEQAWDAVVQRRGDRALRGWLREIYGLQVESLTYSVASRALLALFADRDYPLRVDDLAAGMRSTLRLLMAFLLTDESALLIEEWDAYQASEALPRLAAVLFRLAAERKTQLFLSTHSLETVRALATASLDVGPGALRVFQTRLGVQGGFEAAGLDARQAIALIDGGVDVRKVG